MKAIVTRINDDGSFDEVGMNNRFVTRAAKLSTIVKRARQYGKGKRCRIECFVDSEFYKSPFVTTFVS